MSDIKKLNLGCGDDVKDGFINVDIRNLDNVIQCDITKPLPFQDNEFDYILMSDVIEHFSIKDLEKYFPEWIRVLKKGGGLQIRTPNLLWMCKEYLKSHDAEFISWHIFGGQDYSTNFHYVIFDRKSLNRFLLLNNCFELEYKEKGSNMIIIAKKG